MKTKTCDVCGNNWTISYLCPECWHKFLEHLNEDNTCWRCGGEYMMRLTGAEGEEDIESIYCPRCKTIYRPF
jgi:DNA-directed RNA polymerase subunit RPC12/RpoP